MPLHFAHPWAFAVAVPTGVLALGLMGLLMASSFILYRHANALSNLLEYPVWVATGLLFPLALLPGWVAPISWLLAPRWGIDAIRHSALGGSVCLVAAAVFATRLSALREEARQLIVSQGLAGGDPPAEVTIANQPGPATS